MTIQIAINGYGRIGRCITRALYESKMNQHIKLVAINDLAEPKTNAHLTQYDTTHGKFNGDVHVEGQHLVINGDKIVLTAERDPAKLPWKQLGIDVVLECTGFFTERDQAAKHLVAGAKKVLISAPAKNVDATVVFGVNHHILGSQHDIISNASCTTNCLAPIAKVLHEKFGIESGLMNTIHSYTNDQRLLDSAHEDLHRARAAAHSMIPTKTGAAAAVGIVLPELNGKLDGFAIRVPTINVSVVDFTFTTARQTTAAEINEVLRAASKGAMAGVISINDLPLVSVDFNHNPSSSIVDIHQTKVIGKIAKVLAWYDNEWGFSNRMLDITKALMQ